MAKEFLMTQIIFVTIMGVCWTANLLKFADCDFEYGVPLTCEIIHGVGLFPPFSVATVWFATDLP